MSFLGSANPTQGTGDELNVIAAAVIGGVSLFGGQGTLFGTVLGAAWSARSRTGSLSIRCRATGPNSWSGV